MRKVTRINFDAEPKQKARWEREARRMGVNLSQFIRLTLNKALVEIKPFEPSAKAQDR